MKEPGEENDLAGTHGGAGAFARECVCDRDAPDLLPDAAAFPTRNLSSSKMDEAHLTKRRQPMKKRRKKTKLKGRMNGAMLRAFAAGILDNKWARAHGYDPIAVRKYHHLAKSKRERAPIGSNHDTPIPPATD